MALALHTAAQPTQSSGDGWREPRDVGLPDVDEPPDISAQVAPQPRNVLYHGDNLDVLADLRDESVDLIYLDPPFKSNKTYNVLYREQNGTEAAAQKKVFGDTWTWDPKAAKTYRKVVESGGPVAETLEAFRRVLGTVDRRKEMLAYLTMMAPRLVELSRVLKLTGSIFLHCDPSASHYLKVLLDAVFGSQQFRNEIIWKRTPFSGSSKARARQFPRSHDVILFYTKSDTYTWNPVVRPYSEKYLKRFKWDDNDGRGPYRKTLLKTYSDETFKRLEADTRLIAPVKPGAKWSYKQYLQKSSGTTQIDDVWTDINAINPVAKERVGYPTQKPMPLLKRIIEASSNKGDVVLDPFCGCGTTIEIADAVGRQWKGIDITHLAIDEVEGRLNRNGVKVGIGYRVDARHAPKTLPDVESMANRDKHTFQGWALYQAGIEPFQLKPGPDRGIDARKVFFDPAGSDNRREIIVSVKGGRLKANDVRDLIGTVQRERAQIGVLITLRRPTANMIRDAADVEPYRSNDGRLYPAIQILTVSDLLEGKVIEYPLQVVPRYEVPTVPMLTTARKVRTERVSALPEKARKMAKVVQPDERATPRTLQRRKKSARSR